MPWRSGTSLGEVGLALLGSCIISQVGVWSWDRCGHRSSGSEAVAF
jgi:hypothetical protein